MSQEVFEALDTIHDALIALNGPMGYAALALCSISDECHLRTGILLNDTSDHRAEMSLEKLATLLQGALDRATQAGPFDSLAALRRRP
jgi:hypothetical protein